MFGPKQIVTRNERIIMRGRFTLVVLLVIVLCGELHASWLGFRGNNAEYRADAPWEVVKGVVLDLRWKKTIGSGYSQVVDTSRPNQGGE